MRLAELHPSFTVVPDPPSRLPSPPTAQLLETFPFCPADYVSLVTELDGFSVRSVDQNQPITIHFMGLDDALAIPTDYPFVEELGKSFFFTTDGDLSYFYTVEEGNPRGV